MYVQYELYVNFQLRSVALTVGNLDLTRKVI